MRVDKKAPTPAVVLSVLVKARTWRPWLCRLGIHRWRTNGLRYIDIGRLWECERCAAERKETKAT